MKPDEKDAATNCRDISNPHLWEVNWVRDCVWLLLIALVVWFVLWLRAIFQPVLLAVLFAYLVNPIVLWLEEKSKWSRLSCVIVLFTFASTLLIGFGLFLIPTAVSQAEQLFRALPDYVDVLAQRIGVRDEELLRQVREKSGRFLQNPVSNLSYLWDGVVTSVGLLSGLVGATTAIVMAISMFPLYLFFFSWKWPSIAASPRPFVPESRRDRVHEVLAKMDKAVGDYFRTRLIIALIMGVMYAAGWGISGVPYWLLVGMLGGLLGIVPYAAGIAWLVAMLLRFLEVSDDGATSSMVLNVVVWPTLVFAAVQTTDDWILTPWLQGRQFDMSFVTIILAVLVGGAVAGLLGMLLAVPAAACLRIFWSDVMQPRLLRYADSH